MSDRLGMVWGVSRAVQYFLYRIKRGIVSLSKMAFRFKMCATRSLDAEH